MVQKDGLEIARTPYIDLSLWQQPYNVSMGVNQRKYITEAKISD